MLKTGNQLPKLRHETWYKGKHQRNGCCMITKMPTQSTMIKIRLENIATCLNAAVITLELISKELKTPFLEPIVNTVCSLLTAAQVIILDSTIMLVTE